VSPKGDILVEEREGGFAVVTLNRPAKRNCVSLAMWRELGTIFHDLGRRSDIRVITLKGAGGNFCSGADIGEFATVRGDAAGAAADEAAVHDCPRPTIAHIQGYCVGGGCGLALACDFRIADPTARVGIPAARLGIVYGLTDCRLLLALVGLAGAKRVLYTGEIFDAEAAHAMGLLDVVAEDADKSARELAARLAENAPLSIAGAKLILHAIADQEVDERRAAVEAVIAQAADSRDYREAARAFVEKRRPTFRGE
jgi:enoyl-CoA hydratase/carnithine racemase